MGVLSPEEALACWERRFEAATMVFLALGAASEIVEIAACPMPFPYETRDLTVIIRFTTGHIWFLPIDEALEMEPSTLQAAYQVRLAWRNTRDGNGG